MLRAKLFDIMIWVQINKFQFMCVVHGVNKGRISPYTDIEFQLRIWGIVVGTLYTYTLTYPASDS